MPAERQPQSKAFNLGILTGGMNTALPPNLIADTEAQLIRNYEYDHGRLRTRGGYGSALITLDGDTIESFFYDKNTEAYILFGATPTVTTDTAKVYVAYVGGTVTNVGKLTGREIPCCVRFGANIIIASGGKLQYYSFTANTLTTISAGYLFDNIFVRDSRLLASQRGDDKMYCSSTGDATSSQAWVEDTNVASQMQWFEIGQLDGGDIITVLPLAGDLIVFKTSGRVYRISGHCPDYSVDEIGTDSHAVDYKRAFAVVGASILFVTDLGIRALETIQEYGNFSANETCYKINKNISSKIYNPKIWNLLTKRQAVTCPDSTNTKLMYVYQYDSDMAYELEFAGSINDMSETDNGVMLAIGASLYRWNFASSTDNGTAINSQIISKQYITPGRIITRYFDIFLETSATTGTMNIRCGPKSFNYSVIDKHRIKHFYGDLRAFEVEINCTVPHYINNFILYGIET